MKLIPVAASGHPVVFGAGLRRQFAEAAAEAPESHILALQTDAGSSLSYPLVSLLRASGMLWLVDGADGEVRNGFTDSQPGAAFAPGKSPAVVFSASALHAAGEDLHLGGFTSRMLGAAGLRPGSMGLTEPMQHPWDMDVLTIGLREQVPVGVVLLAGEGFSGSVGAHRTEAGVVESFDVLVSVGSWDWDLSMELADAAVEENAQALGVDMHGGTLDGFVQEGGDRYRAPGLRVYGPSRHRGVPEGLEHSAELRGLAPFQHLILTLPERAS